MTPDELIARRSFPVPPARVWSAFTKPESIAAFWGGSHATVASWWVTVDLRPGGEFTVRTFAPGRPDRTLRFVYVTVAPPHELVFDEPATGIRTTVTFAASGDGTDLTVHQRHLPPELRTRQAADGLASILAALATHLEEGNHALDEECHALDEERHA